MKKTIATALMAAGAIAALGVSSPSYAQKKTYTFGAMLPLTGPAASIGTVFQQGLDMAVDKIDANGGVDGWTLKAIVVDHKATAQGGVMAMSQLVNLDHVPYVLSSFSSVALASQPSAAQNHVLLINIGGPSDNLLNRPWLYNNQVMGVTLNDPLAKYLHERGLKTAALLTSEDAYGHGDAHDFTKSWEALGGKVVAADTFPVDATDFTPQLTKIRGTNPDVLYIVAVGSTQGLLVKQARALGIKSQIVGPLATNALIKVGGAASNGFLATGIAVDPATKDPAARSFLDAFKSKHGQYPEWDSGTAYEAVYLLADLIREVDAKHGDPRSGDALLAALKANPTFQNYLAAGKVTFRDDHGSSRAVAIQEIEDGKFITVKVTQP
jgi:ABC-type branched-subunit amino acid transport system substrate-binding protein